jgi:hypothetical protein
MPTITHTPRQQPAATALDQLLADAESAARSLEDNSREDGQPVDALAVTNWRRRLHSISYLLTNASTPPLPPACYLPAFPSFTGKELL